MKKLICLILSLMIYTSAGAEEWLTISQLQAQTPKRWTKTFQTRWRDVPIDAEILIPQVDKIPVILICGGAIDPEQITEETGWDKVVYRGPYNLILSNHVPDYPEKVDGVRIGAPVSKENWYDGFMPENQYVPLDNITFGEIVSRAEERIAELGYHPDDFELETPVRLWVHHIYADGTTKDVLPGYLFMDVRPKVAGIPVMSHIIQAVESPHGSNRNDEWMLLPITSIGYNGYLNDLSHIFLTPLAVCEKVIHDIPLCNLKTVLKAIEDEIVAGHIRKVYEIELGYVAYNELGVFRTAGSEARTKSRGEEGIHQDDEHPRYYLRPMWQVNCLYAEKATASLRNEFHPANDERNSLDYRQLLIDAQTGVLVEQSNAKDRCAFIDVTLWEDVQ